MTDLQLIVAAPFIIAGGVITPPPTGTGMILVGLGVLAWVWAAQRVLFRPSATRREANPASGTLTHRREVWSRERVRERRERHWPAD